MRNSKTSDQIRKRIEARIMRRIAREQDEKDVAGTIMRPTLTEAGDEPRKALGSVYKICMRIKIEVVEWEHSLEKLVEPSGEQVGTDGTVVIIENRGVQGPDDKGNSVVYRKIISKNG